MWPRRIAFAIVLVGAAGTLTLATYVFLLLPRIESPERYLALIIGLAMLYLGVRLIMALIRPAKEKDPNAPIEIPPLDQVRGRTVYRDSSPTDIFAMLAIGAIFLLVSLSVAPQQPAVLVIAFIAAGVMVAGGVKLWRRMQFGRARLELLAPARRGDTMNGVITTSGSAWNGAGEGLFATVEIAAIQSFSAVGHSGEAVIAQSYVDATHIRDGNDITFRFSIEVPVIDTSEGKFSWNIQLETETPKHRATFLVDVA